MCYFEIKKWVLQIGCDKNKLFFIQKKLAVFNFTAKMGLEYGCVLSKIRFWQIGAMEEDYEKYKIALDSGVNEWWVVGFMFRWYQPEPG